MLPTAIMKYLIKNFQNIWKYKNNTLPLLHQVNQKTLMNKFISYILSKNGIPHDCFANSVTVEYYRNEHDWQRISFEKRFIVVTASTRPLIIISPKCPVEYWHIALLMINFLKTENTKNTQKEKIDLSLITVHKQSAL